MASANGTGKELPSNVDSERALLGSMMMEPHICRDVFRVVGAKDFYLNAHQIIFQRMQAVYARHSTLELTLLSDAVRKSGELDAVGGYVYLAGLVEFVLYTGAAMQNAEMVLEYSRQRQIVALSDRFRRMAMGCEKPAAELVAEMTEAVASFRKAGPNDGWKVGGIDTIRELRPPTRFVVEGLIPEGSFTMVSAKGGVMKSMLAMDLCTCIASGRDFLSPDPSSPPPPNSRTFRVDQGPVFWFNADNPTRVVLDRFKALDRGHGLTEYREVPIFHANYPEPFLDMRTEEGYMRMCDELGKVKPRLCVVDCLAATCPGANENDAGEMGAVMMNYRRVVESTGTAVMLIHHHKKTQDEMRGSSALRDKLDFNFTVHREEGVDRIEVRPDKERGAHSDAFGAAFWFRHAPGGKDMEACRFFPYPAAEMADGSVESLVLDALRESVAPKSASALAKLVGKGYVQVAAACRRMAERGRVQREVRSTGRSPGAYYSVSEAEALSDAPP